MAEPLTIADFYKRFMEPAEAQAKADLNREMEELRTWPNGLEWIEESALISEETWLKIRLPADGLSK